MRRSGQTATALVLLLCAASPAFARKTNQPVYEDPFDIAAGGASLTRASKEGRIFTNPALMPLGNKFHHWAGSTFTLLADRDSVDTARGLINAARGGNSGSETEEEKKTAQQEQQEGLVDKALDQPVHLGWAFALSWLTGYFGLGIFSRFEPDVRVKEYGEYGAPELQLRAESYHGAAVGIPLRTGLRWLHLGVTAKYILAAEPDAKAAVTSKDDIQQLATPEYVRSQTDHNKGVGFDAGALVFVQGSWVDLSLAGKVDDVGNTKLTGNGENPKELKQVTSAGLGLTLHTGADAIHFAADYRDLGNVYGEEPFKRFYAGTKVLLRTYLGLAAGYYNGYPSMGAELDLIFVRLAFVKYTRELGDHPGVDPRHIYMVSMSTGF